MFNFEWLAVNPRGLITYLALCATVLASAHVLQDRRWFWKATGVLSAGVAVCSVLTVYESLTGQFNALGLFEGSDERAYGLADPNYTAALLVTLLPFVIAQLLRAKSLIARVLFLLQLALAYTAIGMTASRGGILGALLTTAFAVAWMPFTKGRGSHDGRSSARALAWLTQRIALISVLFLGIAAAAAVAPTIFWERLSTLEDWSKPDTVHGSRAPIWEYYMNRWRQSPVWGFGPGYVDPAVGLGREDLPHNTPLQVLVETGICGAMGFLLLNGVALWQALKARKQFSQCGERGLSLISGATAVALVGFHSTAFFLTSATHKELWLLLGLATALYCASKPAISDGLDGRAFSKSR
jgi:O-antigen ligase